MVQFTDEDKEGTEFKDTFFKFGVHKVQIDGVVIDEDDQDREYVEVGVIDPENADTTANVRMWLHTDGSKKFTFSRLRDLYVHNAPKEEKENARISFDAVEDGVELIQLLDKLIGKDAWIDVYPDPTRKYQNSKGEWKPSINTNIYGYEPKPRPELLPDTTKQVDPSDYPTDGNGKDEPFGSDEEERKKASGNKTVPKAW